MQHLSFQAAKYLKECGFPQPDFEFGQLWMTEDERHFAFVGTAQMEQLKQHHIGQMIFLPTAIDILKEMPECKIYWSKTQAGSNWVVSLNDVIIDWHKESAVKAAASAWVGLNDNEEKSKAPQSPGA